MIELLKIHALVRIARILVFVGRTADDLSKACLRKGIEIADYLTAWMDQREAWRRPEKLAGPKST